MRHARRVVVFAVVANALVRHASLRAQTSRQVEVCIALSAFRRAGSVACRRGIGLSVFTHARVDNTFNDAATRLHFQVVVGVAFCALDRATRTARGVDVRRSMRTQARVAARGPAVVGVFVGRQVESRVALLAVELVVLVQAGGLWLAEVATAQVWLAVLGSRFTFQMVGVPTTCASLGAMHIAVRSRARLAICARTQFL